MVEAGDGYLRVPNLIFLCLKFSIIKNIKFQRKKRLKKYKRKLERKREEVEEEKT